MNHWLSASCLRSSIRPLHFRPYLSHHLRRQRRKQKTVTVGGGNRKKDEEKRLPLTLVLPRLTIASRLSKALAFLLARTEWRGLFTGLIPRPPLSLSIHPPLCFNAPFCWGQREKLGSSSCGKRSSRRMWALEDAWSQPLVPAFFSKY